MKKFFLFFLAFQLCLSGYGQTPTAGQLGNIFSGSFKQFSDSSTYSFSGTYDGNAQMISGSLGSDTATTGQGRWTVTKQ